MKQGQRCTATWPGRWGGGGWGCEAGRAHLVHRLQLGVGEVGGKLGGLLGVRGAQLLTLQLYPQRNIVLPA